MNNNESYKNNPTSIRGLGKFNMTAEIAAIVRIVLSFGLLYMAIDTMIQNRFEAYGSKLGVPHIELEQDLLKQDLEDNKVKNPDSLEPAPSANVKTPSSTPAIDTPSAEGPLRLRDAK